MFLIFCGRRFVVCTAALLVGISYLLVLSVHSVSAAAPVFSARQDVAVGSKPVGVVAADFNKDGKADLASANAQGATVSVLLGKGDGTFTPGVTLAMPEVGVLDFFRHQ